MVEASISKEISMENFLLILTREVVENEGWKIVELGEQYKKHYVEANKKDGDRCVDGRKRLESILEGDEIVDWLQAEYKGRQFPGGSNGVLGALRVITGLEEVEARDLVKKTYGNHQSRLGNHNDDKHGEIKDFQGIEKRREGCGNQDKIVAGAISMYQKLGVDSLVKSERIQWVKDSSGSFPALAGEHEEKAVAVNLTEGTTFDTTKAVGENESIFNADLPAAMEVGGWLYEEFNDEQKTDLSKEEFVKSFAKEVLRDYLQTAEALGAEKVLSVNTSERV